MRGRRGVVETRDVVETSTVPDAKERELKEKEKVNIVRTSKDIFEAQAKAWDGLIATLSQDAFMKKVMDSQKAWTKRVAYYEFLNAADYRTAYEHHFGKLEM